MIEGISSNPSENQEVNKHTRWHNNMGCEDTSIGTYHHDEKYTESKIQIWIKIKIPVFASWRVTKRLMS